MREIKFRAWSIKENEMINDVFVVDTRTQHLMPLMQYTGLKDKNGQEIYEGDIICWVDEVAVEEIEGHIRYEPEGKFLEVKIPDFYFFTADTVTSEECEIIGNIYENPELLSPTNPCSAILWHIDHPELENAVMEKLDTPLSEEVSL